MSTKTNYANLDKPLTESFEYSNPYGLLTRVTSSATGDSSRYEIYQYDPRGRFITGKTNKLGHTAGYDYDGKYGNILANTDANGLQTVYDYDSFGKLAETTLPNGKTITNVIDWADGDADAPDHSLYFTLAEKEGGAPKKAFHDLTGRIIRDVTVGFDGTGIYSDVLYNPDGTVYKVSDPYFENESPEWTSFSYDDYLRKTGVDSPTADISISYNGRSVTTTNTSASPNRSSTKTIDASGKVSNIQDEGGDHRLYLLQQRVTQNSDLARRRLHLFRI